MTRTSRLTDGSGGNVLAGAQKDVIRGSMWTLLSTLISAPVIFVSSLLLARFLGPAEYGRLATYSTAMVVLGAISGLGFNEATIQWAAAARVRGDAREVGTLLRNCSGFHVYVDGPVVGIVVLIFLRDAPPLVMACGVVAAVVTKVAGGSLVVLTAYMANALAARVAFMTTIIGQALLVGAAAAGRTAEWTWVGQLIAGSLLPAACWMWLTPNLRRALLHPTFPTNMPIGFTRFALNSWAVSCLSLLVFGRTEVFVLAWYHATAVIGVYALASTLAGQVTILMDSLMGPIAPAATTVVAQNTARAGASLERAIRVSGILACLTLALVLTPLAQLVETLYGSQYAGTRWALLALGGISCFASAVHPIDAFGFALRMAPKVLLANVVALAVGLLLAFALIPWSPMAGAVIANGGAQATALGALMYLVIRRLGLTLRVLHLVLSPFLLGAAAATAGLSVSLAGLPAWPTTLATLTVSTTVAAALAHTTNALRLPASDARMIQNHLPRYTRDAFRIIARMFAILPNNATNTVR